MRGRASSGLGVAAALVALGVVACSAFGAAEDVSSAATDASVVDGGGGGGDGPLDAPPAADAGAGCTVLIKEPFDTLAEFVVDSNTPGSQVGLSDTRHKSAPTALLVQAQGEASVSRDFVPKSSEAGKDLVVDFDVWVGKTGTYVELGCTVELRNAQGDSTRLVFAKQSDDGLAAVWNTSFDSGQGLASAAPPIKQDEWQHVRLVIDPTSPTQAQATFTVTPTGGNTSTQLTVALPPGADRLKFVCGIDYTETSTANLSVWVDDLVVQACPAR